MRYETFQIDNYKSFRDSPEIRFEPGFNVIVGQNNAGKSTLLSALAIPTGPAPHRSPETALTPEVQLQTECAVKAVFDVEPHELKGVIAAIGLVSVPVTEGMTPEQAIEQFRQAIEQPGRLICRFVNGNCVAGHLEALGNVTSEHCIDVKMTSSGRLESHGSRGARPDQQYGVHVANRLRSRIYLFRAERYNIGSSGFGAISHLDSNAHNLPTVLSFLSGDNPARFRAYNELVKTVFPFIREISVTPTSNNSVEIRLWTVDPMKQRPDLAFSILESGTGIAQVLAMLYVAISSDFPRVILIDEPQSFLHPGALRKLLGILKSYEQHQFIITTHSPLALTEANPKTILLLKNDDFETSVGSLDAESAEALRDVLAEIGARPSDLFGADAILWVEGVTEEQCYPIILRKSETRLPLGTAIIAVRSTSELEGRKADAVFDIHARFSTKQVLVPPALAFVFDWEGRSDSLMNDIQKRSGGRAFFLTRRMYENYLLNPDAIVHLMAREGGFGPVTRKSVEEWLSQRWEKKYLRGSPPATAKRTHEYWLKHVDGARVLTDLFSAMSDPESPVPYDKVRHDRILTEWICENAPHEVEEIKTLLERITGGQQSDRANSAEGSVPDRL